MNHHEPPLCSRNPRLFDSRAEGEPHKHVAARHRLAVLACRNCPALTACAQHLADAETNGARIDGIIAGRTWRRLRDLAPNTRTCLHCGTTIVKRGTPAADRLRPDGTLTPLHAGRNLCTDCYNHHEKVGTLNRYPRIRNR